MDLTQKLAELAARAKARQQTDNESSNPTPATPAHAAVIPFPIQWGNDVRAMPDICLRSALFGVIKPGRRRYLKDELLAAQDGYEVRYTGERLDQADSDLFQQILHSAQQYPLGARVPIRLYSVLKAIGRCTGKSDYQWANSSLIRQRANAVMLKHGKRLYCGGLLDEWMVDEATGEAWARLNPTISQFFQRDCYTLIDFQRRLSIQSQLGRWLHDYYSTHAKPYPVKVATLRALCGSEAGELRKFRQELRKALSELVQASLLTAWEIDTDDLVHVTKHPSPSQGRHLVREITKVIREPRKPKK